MIGLTMNKVSEAYLPTARQRGQYPAIGARSIFDRRQTIDILPSPECVALQAAMDDLYARDKRAARARRLSAVLSRVAPAVAALATNVAIVAVVWWLI